MTRPGRAMLCTVAIWGAAFAGFAVASSLWLTLSLLAVAGAADAFTVVFRGTIVAAITPDRLRGRVMAADYVVGAGGGQLGSLESGALGSLTSPVVSAFTGGLVTVVGALVLGVALPAFTRYRREPDGSAREGVPGGSPTDQSSVTDESSPGGPSRGLGDRSSVTDESSPGGPSRGAGDRSSVTDQSPPGDRGPQEPDSAGSAGPVPAELG